MRYTKKFPSSFFFAVFMLLSGLANAQASLTWDKATLEKANSAKDVTYMNAEEKRVVFYTNLVRLNPQLFLKTYVIPYVDSAKMRHDKYVTSLIKDLEKAKASDAFAPMNDLYGEAKNHAGDMGKSGNIGHNTSKGENFQKRIVTLKKTYTVVFENCQYGYDKALDVVMDLLIDEGITDYGHRKALLNSSLQYVGVSFQKHKKFKWNCVMVMGGEKI